MIIVLVRRRKGFKMLIENKVVGICLLWIFIRIVFFTWYNPHEPFLWSVGTLIPFMVFMATLIHMTIREDNKLLGRLITLLLFGCTVWIMISNTFILMPLRKDFYHQFVSKLEMTINKNDLILTDDWSVKISVDYYTELRAVFVPDAEQYLIDQISKVAERNGKTYIIVQRPNSPVWGIIKKLRQDLPAENIIRIAPQTDGFENLQRFNFRKKEAHSAS
jgi:hypothetical protein